MHAPNTTGSCLPSALVSSSTPPIREEEKEREFRCVDGKVRAYTKDQLKHLSQTLLTTYTKKWSSSETPITRETLKEIFATYPLSSKDNVFVGCRLIYTPKIEIEFSLMKPLFPDNSTSLFPSSIGMYYTLPNAVYYNPFGLILAAGETISITECVDLFKSISSEKPISIGDAIPQELRQIKAKVLMGGESEEKILKINLHQGRIFIEIPLCENRGPIHGPGEFHLQGEEGLEIYSIEDHMSPVHSHFFIGVPFTIGPLFFYALGKKEGEQG